MPTLLLIRRENQQMLRLITSLSLHWTFETATQSFISPQRRTPTMIMQSINLTDKGLWSMGKLAPKQLCEEFRAGVDGACAPNLNSCAKCNGAKSTWTWRSCIFKGSIGASTNNMRRKWSETQMRPSSIQANLDEPEPILCNIDTLLHHHYLPTLRRIEEMIGCCQGSFCFSPSTFPGFQLQLLAQEETQDIPRIMYKHHLWLHSQRLSQTIRC